MKYGFTTYEHDRVNHKIVGYFTFVEREKSEFIISTNSFYDVIDEAEDNQTEVFLEYNFVTKEGYYDYPLSDDENFRINLKELSVLQSVNKLEEVIKYDKTLKFLGFTIKKIIRNYNKPIIITGSMSGNFNIDDNSVEISDYFLTNLRKNTSKFTQSVFKDSVLSELQILNTVMDESKFGLSIYTRQFISTFINNLLDKGLRAERYQYIIEKFKDMINKKVSEKKWQEFLYENYRYIFPEYVLIAKEYELLTIDEDKKYVDFLLENQSSSLLLEVKLPSQQIMSESKDRNNYYFMAGMNKAMFQVQRYFMTYKHRLFASGTDKNTKAMLLVGWKVESKNETDKINNDFELARSMYKDIQIVTYSELLERIENTYHMIKNQ